MKPALRERESYRPSWRVGPAAPVWLALLFAATALAAWVLDLCWSTGHYMVVLAPALAALLLAGFMVLVVDKGRVRHSILACALGSLVGGAMYLGHFHIGMAREIRTAFGVSLPWCGVRLLPTYVRWRMANTVTHNAYEPKAEAMKKAATPGMNWFGFALELGICVVLVGGAGYRRARRPYGEESGEWLQRSVRSLPASALDAMVAALDRRDAEALAVAAAAGPAGGFPRLDLAIDHVQRRQGRFHSNEAYLSLKLVKADPRGVVLDRFESSKGRLVVDRVRIDGRELSTLLPVPGQPDVVKTPPPVAEHVETQTATRHREDIPEGEAAGVLRTKGKLTGSLMALLPAIAMLGGLALVLFGLAGGADQGRQPQAAAALGGGVLVVVGLFEGLFGVMDVATRRLRRLCAAAVRKRGRRLVDPDAPGVSFVEVVPRDNWQRVTLDNAGDVGFLRVDVAQGVLFFEGEAQRWSCPVAAIAHAVLAEHAVPGGNQVMVFVVLAVRDADGVTRELPLRERGHVGMLGSGPRRRRARELHREILEAMRTHGCAAAAGP